MARRKTPMNELKYLEISLNEICSIIEKRGKFLIIGHTNPDGDAVGSAFALALIVRAAGGEAKCVMPDEVQGRLKFLFDSQDSILYDEGEEKNYDVVCSVDVASIEQLGSLAHLAPVVDFMIDHHETGSPFAPNLVNPKAAAAAEIIYAIYRKMILRGSIKPQPDVSRRIYSAIVSDTGSFKYSNVTPNTHSIASELVREINNDGENGFTTEELCRSLFGQRTMKDLTAQMLSIQNLKLFEEDKIGVVLLTADALKEAGLDERDAGNTVETPRSLEGVKIAISMRQNFNDPTLFKLSSRSNGSEDVAAVCAKFGGGGHKKAAGCTIKAESPEEAVRIAVEAFSRVVL